MVLIIRMNWIDEHKIINEHAQAMANALPKKYNSKETARRESTSSSSLANAASLFKAGWIFFDHIQPDIIVLWGLAPFYWTQDWVSFRETSSISISLEVNHPHQFLRIKMESSPSSGCFLALSNEIWISFLKLQVDVIVNPLSFLIHIEPAVSYLTVNLTCCT